MRPYEVMIIFDVELEQNDLAQRLDRVVEQVKSGGGTSGRVDHWGRRTFAYELDHKTEGYYVLVEMAAEPAAMATVDRMLALDDAVLRHKIMRQPEHVVRRSRSSSGSRRPAPRGPAPSGRAGGGRSPEEAATRGSARPGSAEPSGGGTDTASVSAVTIEGAEQPGSGAGSLSADQEPATS
jgi:small subunit ribosomal protein S6